MFGVRYAEAYATVGRGLGNESDARCSEILYSLYPRVQTKMIRWALALVMLFYIPIVVTEQMEYSYVIGAPTKSCTIRYDVEDNDCVIFVLSRERVIPKKRKRK